MPQEIVTLQDTEDAVELTGMNFDVLEKDDETPMAKLTVRQRRWVVAFCALAGAHGALTRAAEYAGYSPGTCAVRGSQLYRKDYIQAAIKYLAETKAHVAAFAAMNTLEEIMRGGTENNRLKASTTLLGHAGIIVATVARHEISIDDNRTEAQILVAVQEQMKALGLDATVIDEISVTVTAPEDDGRSHASGERPDGMNLGRPRYKQQLIPGKDRPEKIKKTAAEVFGPDAVYSELDFEDGEFDDVGGDEDGGMFDDV